MIIRQNNAVAAQRHRLVWAVCFLMSAVVMLVSGCSGELPRQGLDREVDDTIRMHGFYADLHTDGVRTRRVMAESAVYTPVVHSVVLADVAYELVRPISIFHLTNVKVEFFDPEGLTISEELYAREGIWYGGDVVVLASAPEGEAPDAESVNRLRAKNDLDLRGNVLYTVLKNRDALSTAELHYVDETGRFSSDAGFIKVLMGDEEEPMMTVFRGRGFSTDRAFGSWTYQQARIERLEKTAERYREFIPEPPANAPKFSDHDPS